MALIVDGSIERRITSYVFENSVSKKSANAVLGHSQANTTYRYVNANVETAKRAPAALDAFNAETMEAETPPELVH